MSNLLEGDFNTKDDSPWAVGMGLWGISEPSKSTVVLEPRGVITFGDIRLEWEMIDGKMSVIRLTDGYGERICKE